MHINKIENEITFKIKTAYYLELLTPETMKLFGNTRSKITTGENGENKHDPESTKVVLVHCSIANNSYQQDLEALYTNIRNKSFDQLVDISPKTFIVLVNQKIFHSEIFQNFHILKYGSLNKIINRQRQKIK